MLMLPVPHVDINKFANERGTVIVVLAHPDYEGFAYMVVTADGFLHILLQPFPIHEEVHSASHKVKVEAKGKPFQLDTLLPIILRALRERKSGVTVKVDHLIFS